MCFSIEIKKDLKLIAQKFNAQINSKLFYKLDSQIKLNPKLFKKYDHKDRVFPNTFAPIIISKNDKLEIIPARYRIRPKNSLKEVPQKYNLYNARLDSLLKRDSWNKIAGKQNGVIVINKFFEWVEIENQKKIISFKYKQPNIDLLAPVIFDYYEDKENQDLSFYSFAIITGPPPQEILQAGHDRCPIFINHSQISSWTKQQSINESIRFLKKINLNPFEFSNEDQFFN